MVASPGRADKASGNCGIAHHLAPARVPRRGHREPHVRRVWGTTLVTAKERASINDSVRTEVCDCTDLACDLLFGVVPQARQEVDDQIDSLLPWL